MNHADPTPAFPVEGTDAATVDHVALALVYAYAFFFTGYVYFYFYAFDMAGGF